MEKTIGTLEGVQGHTYDTVYDLVFTTDRVVAALVRHPTDVSPSFGFTEFFFGRGLAGTRERSQRAAIGDQRRKAYQGMSLEDVLAAHPRNFQLRYAEVQRVELSRKLLRWRMVFHTATPLRSRIRFLVPRDLVPEARRMLKEAVPPSLLQG